MNAIPPFVVCWASAQDRAYIAAVTDMAMSNKAVLANMSMLRELFPTMSIPFIRLLPQSLYFPRLLCVVG